MRFSSKAILLLVALAVFDHTAVAVAKKPSRPSPSSRRGGSSARPSRSSSSSRRSPPPRRRDDYEDDYDAEEEEFGFPDDPFEEEEDIDEEYDEEEEEEDYRPPSKRQGSSKRSGNSRGPPSKKRPSTSRRPASYDDYDDDYDRPSRRPSSGSRRPSGRGPPPRRSGGRRSVVPYTRHQQPSAFGKFTQGLKSSMPDPSSVRAAAVSSLNMARETTSNLSSNIYREVKGLTSSELEQVMLKATRPDDTAVKGKHVERLVGVTYQISGRYDIYDAVLRKLWSKMAEKDWRTTIKSLYILHRFAADGAPEHAPALKARLRELRRTRDPKRKDKYFNSKQLLAGDNKPETAKFRAFMSRYAHYVLLRAQCFGGMFEEISSDPAAGKDKKRSSSPKPVTSTCLRTENLDAAALILKAGVACQLKDGEECENTAIAVERVASDLMGLCSAVAISLNRVLKDDSKLKGADLSLIKRWCEFYSEDLLPQTRAMVKKTTPKLDAYGLFLPSRMKSTVSQDLLRKGLKLEDKADVEDEPVDDDEEEVEVEEEIVVVVEEEIDDDDGEIEDGGSTEKDDKKPVSKKAADVGDEPDAGDEYDEYEYDDEEYYDDEEPF